MRPIDPFCAVRSLAVLQLGLADLVLLLRFAFPFGLGVVDDRPNRPVIRCFLLYFRDVIDCMLPQGRVVEVWCMNLMWKFLNRDDATSRHLLSMGFVVALTNTAQLFESLFKAETLLLGCLQQFIVLSDRIGLILN